MVDLVIPGPRTRRRDGRRSELPTLLEVAARELRSGRNLHDALRAASTDVVGVGPGLALALARADSGERLIDSLDRWAADFDHSDADLIRAVLNVGSSTGGSMARSIERAAVTLRERAALRDEVRALTAQARTSALVLTLAPVGFLVIVAGADPGALAFVLTSAAGRACLLVGVGLDALGFWWMRQLVDSVSR